MKIYFHEREKIVSLLKNPKREKRGINLFLRNSESVNITPEQINILSTVFGPNYQNIKPILSNKNTLFSFFKEYLEKLKKINNKRIRRK